MNRGADNEDDGYDPFEIEFNKRKKTRKDAGDGKPTAKPLRPDAFANFVVPVTLDALNIHLGELEEYARQIHTLSPSSTREKKDEAKDVKEPWEGNEPLTYVVELIHDDEDGSLPAALVADDYEPELAGRQIAASIKLDATQPTGENKTSGGGAGTNVDWRRRFAWSVLLSTSGIESKFASGNKASLKADFSAVHRAILLGASIAKNFATEEEWRMYLDRAEKLRQQGNIAGGHKRWEDRAPYHAKVVAFARAFWNEHPSASPAEVSRGIIDKLYSWIDKQTDMCDEPKPQERGLAAYLAAKKNEILPPQP